MTPPRPLRVLFVVPDLRHGGAERHVVTLSAALDPHRFAPEVLCLGESGTLFDEVVEAGVPARALGRRKREAAVALAETVAHLRRTRPDIVITRGYNAEMLGRLAAVIARVPHTAIWVHNCAPLEHRGTLRTLSDRLLERATSAYLGVTHAQLPYLTGVLGYPRDKIAIVHNGVEVTRFGGPDAVTAGRAAAEELGIDLNDPIIGILAVLRPEKDHENALRAMALLIRTRPRARLLLIGDGPLRPHLAALAEELGITANVVFAGARNDVPALLTVLDVVALSSRTDCFPISLLEAMASGVPIVGTAVGGVSEIVLDGVTGVLVPPADPGALAAAIEGLLADSSRAGAMGDAARERVGSMFSLDGSVRATEDTIDAIVGAVSPSGAGRRPVLRRR